MAGTVWGTAARNLIPVGDHGAELWSSTPRGPDCPSLGDLELHLVNNLSFLRAPQAPEAPLGKTGNVGRR